MPNVNVILCGTGVRQSYYHRLLLFLLPQNQADQKRALFPLLLLLPIWLGYARCLIFLQNRKNLREETSLLPKKRTNLKYWHNDLDLLLATMPLVRVPLFVVRLSPERFIGSAYFALILCQLLRPSHLMLMCRLPHPHLSLLNLPSIVFLEAKPYF